VNCVGHQLSGIATAADCWLFLLLGWSAWWCDCSVQRQFFWVTSTLWHNVCCLWLPFSWQCILTITAAVISVNWPVNLDWVTPDCTRSSKVWEMPEQYVLQAGSPA